MNPELHLTNQPIPCSPEQGWQVPADELESSTEPETLMDACAWIDRTLGKLMDKLGLREAFEEDVPEEEGGFELFGALLAMLPRKSPSVPKDEPQPFALEMDRLPIRKTSVIPEPVAPYVAPKCKVQLEFGFPDEETLKSLARKRLAKIKALKAKVSLASLMQGLCLRINNFLGSESPLLSKSTIFLKRLAEKTFAIHRKDPMRCTEIIVPQMIASFSCHAFRYRMAADAKKFPVRLGQGARSDVYPWIYSSDEERRYCLRWRLLYRATWVLLCSLYTLIKRERLPLIEIGK
jgi:hypothetical protein